MYATITNVINSWSCQARIAIDYFGSSGFIVPLIIFLLWVSCCSCCIDSSFSVITSVCTIRCLVCVYCVYYCVQFVEVFLLWFWLCCHALSLCRLLCYAEYVVLKAREARFKLIKKQLILVSWQTIADEQSFWSAYAVCILNQTGSLLHSFAHIFVWKLA